MLKYFSPVTKTQGSKVSFIRLFLWKLCAMVEVILEPQKVVFMYLVAPPQKAYILNKIPHNNSSWNS